MSDLIDNGGYRFWDDDFSIQSAYKECKAVFDGITDDDAFQESDTGIILYHAHEIMYALKKALPTAQPDPNCSEIPNNSDTISRQAAIEDIRTMIPKDAQLDIKWIEMWLMQLPSAQPEIIRCGECKWYGRTDKRRFYRGMDCLNKHIDTIIPDRDFCSRAERRSDET